MSHRSQKSFVESCAAQFPEFFERAKVLDIGSGDINGSARALFRESQYIGVDLVASEGVDLVASGHEVRLGKGSFDVAISCECFEHNPYWRETLANMVDHLRDGGLLIVTCATQGRPEHGTPRSQPTYSLSTDIDWDYYHNVSKAELISAVVELPRKVVFRAFRKRSEADVYLVGIVEPSPASLGQRVSNFEPRISSDKSAVMKTFLVISSVLEKYCFVSPYAISKLQRHLQGAYAAVPLRRGGRPRNPS